MSSYFLDLDAERREVQFPHGIPVKFGGEQFLFPAELPADALDPILSEELDLVGLLADVLASTEGDNAGVKEVVNALFRRPSLPRKFLAAVRETYAILLGQEQYAAFASKRPFLGDYVRLTTSLAGLYGVELGKLFRSADSSETGSKTSSPTSPATTTASTPEESGDDQESPDSSASDA